MLTSEPLQMEAFRDELNTTSNNLKWLKALSQEQRSEIEIAQRVTEATEQAAQRVQKEKEEADAAEAALQQQVDFQKAQLALFSEQRKGQEEDAEAARRLLAQAAVDMEGVQLELRARRQQWHSALLGLQRRDEALKDMEEAAQKQSQELQAVDVELKGCHKDIKKAAMRTEQTVAVLERLQGEAVMLSESSTTLRSRQGMLQDTLGRLTASLADTEASLKAEQVQAKSLADSQAAANRATAAARQQLQDVTAQVLLQLVGRTQASRSAQQAAADIEAVRQSTLSEEAAAELLRAKAAQIEADVASAEACNSRHAEALNAAEAELREGEAAIEGIAVEMGKCEGEIERKTREQDVLNKKLEKILAAVPPGEDAGPLEATIANLTREIAKRTEQGHALQLQWVTLQRELLALTASNGAAEEQLAKDTSTHAVMQHRLARLERQHKAEERELADLEKTMSRQRADMSRVNAMLAETTEAQTELASETFCLRRDLDNQLKGFEEEQGTMRYNAEINAVRGEKHSILASTVEAERKVMDWERSIQLHREMALALDPTVGNQEAAMLANEVGRLRAREGELRQVCHHKQAELQRAVDKREVVHLRGFACEDKRAAANIEHRQATMLAALERTLAEVTSNAVAARARVDELAAQQAQLEGRAAETAARCDELCAQGDALGKGIAAATDRKHQALILTSRAQRVAKWYEEAAAGKLTPHTGPEQLQAKVKRATARHEKIQGILRDLCASNPELSPGIERVLMSSVPIAC
ncbi:g8377 [Coccomyxa elongata]